jgi:hypothetical protein
VSTLQEPVVDAEIPQLTASLPQFKCTFAVGESPAQTCSRLLAGTRRSAISKPGIEFSS